MKDDGLTPADIQAAPVQVQSRFWGYFRFDKLMTKSVHKGTPVYCSNTTDTQNISFQHLVKLNVVEKEARKRVALCAWQIPETCL